MSSQIHLFAEDRTRVGHADQEWAVWIPGMDDVRPQEDLTAALQFAAEHNASFAEMRLVESSEYAPVLHAVVLHHGYAWTQDTEHAHGLDCGMQWCGPCSFNRAAAYDRGEQTTNEPMPK